LWIWMNRIRAEEFDKRMKMFYNELRCSGETRQDDSLPCLFVFGNCLQIGLSSGSATLIHNKNISII
jgi:hypothetical protein